MALLLSCRISEQVERGARRAGGKYKAVEGGAGAREGVERVGGKKQRDSKNKTEEMRRAGGSTGRRATERRPHRSAEIISH